MQGDLDSIFAGIRVGCPKARGDTAIQQRAVPPDYVNNVSVAGRPRRPFANYGAGNSYGIGAGNSKNANASTTQRSGNRRNRVAVTHCDRS